MSGIIYVIKHGLMWRDAPRDYGPHKTIYNRFMRWSRLGVFNRIFAELAGKAGEPDRIMIDATHLKAHRTAARLLKGGLFPDVSDAAYFRSSGQPFRKIADKRFAKSRTVGAVRSWVPY